MITNKKTEKQMTEDLELFLGGTQEASNFSAWLHAYIKKITGKLLHLQFIKTLNFI
jgi:hypothetical protein